MTSTLNTASQSGLATHEASITPAYTGSWAVSAEINYASSTPVAAAGNTAIDAVSDTVADPSQSYGWGTYQSTGTLTSGTPFTAGSTDSSNGGVAVLEVPPTGTISIDASSPASVSTVTLGVGATSVTTATFTPPPGTLLLALVTAAGTPAGQAAMTVTDSYGLTWTEAVSATAAGNGYAGIWYAYAPTAVTAPGATTLPGANTGYQYAASVAGVNGWAPYTYALASGSLPSGLALNPDGIIIGVPLTPGTSSFTVTATDSAGATATSGTQSITVASPPIATPFLSGHWKAKPAAYKYGTTTVPVVTIEHDWLFVIVSWTADNDGIATDVDAQAAQAYVTDDAHNVYRLATLAAGFWCRSAIFVVPNARATRNIYCSTSVFVRNMQVTVLELRNLEPGYVVDVTAPTATGTSHTSWTQSITTTQPDFVLAVGEVMGKGAGVTLPSAWSPTQNSNNSTYQPAGTVVGWQYAASPGGISAAFTITGTSTAVPYTGALISFYSQAAGIMHTPGNPAWPSIKVYAAFGYQPGNPTVPPTWTDISSRFLGLNGQRGRSFELDELSAADMELTLDNSDGALTPGNSASPYGGSNVTLMTPIQVLADWQGRRYSLYTGVITAIPQTYEFQYGIVKVALSDDYSKLPQILLPSCMISELLYDIPLHVWPLNEPQGTGQASNWSGRSTAILAPVNSKYGGGATSGTPVTGFGNSLSGNYPAALEGTSDTVWGNAGAAVSGTYVKGTALSSRGNTPLPLLGGATYEFWAQILNDAANLSSKAVLMVLCDDKGTGGGGCILRLAAENYGTVASPKTAFYVLQQGLSWSAGHKFSTKNLFDNGWHHYCVQVYPNKNVYVYIDGVQIGEFKGSFPVTKPTRLQFGGDITANAYWGSKTTNAAAGGGFFTGSISSVAVYDRNIDPERLIVHYNSGANGFVGETSGVRIQRILNYAHWSGPQAIEPGVAHMQIFNYLGGGYASSGLSGAIGNYSTAGGGFVDDGAQADVTIQDIAASECGFLLVGADGTLSFRERISTLNATSKGSLGDMDYALNQTTRFTNGLGTWGTTTSGTLGLTTAWAFAGTQAAVFTVTGSPTSAGVQSELVPVSEAGGSFWALSPTGCYVHVQVNYYNSSRVFISSNSAGDAYLPPNTPGIVTTSAPFQGAQIPANAVYMSFGPTLDQSPATGTQLYFDHPRLSPAGFQVPYNGDVEITTDIQYLYNDIMITRNIDQVLYRAKNDASRAQYYPRVYTRTIYTDEADTQAVVDAAQWLLSSYADPQPRVSQVTIDCALNPDTWTFALGIDIGDLVFFERNPVQGAPVSGNFIVLSIEPDIEPDKAQFTYILAPTVGLTSLKLDDPTYGIIGSNGLAW